MLFYFFFFKQKTAYEMRISDWSSDVCSSDLPPVALRAHAADHEEVAVGIADEIGIDWGAKVERAPEQREVPEAAFQRGLFVHLVLADHRGHQLDGGKDDVDRLAHLGRRLLGQLFPVGLGEIDHALVAQQGQRHEIGEHTSELQSLMRISY